MPLGPPKIPLCILYGSATGNAEHIAKALGESLPKSNPPFYTSVIVCEGNAFRSKCIGHWNKGEKITGYFPVIVVASTTGDGDAPENISRFIRWLKRRDEIPKQPLKHVCFSVLGLGDTNYDKFNATGKLVDKKMKELGAISVKSLALADEGTGLEDVVEPWTDSVIKDLEKMCGRCGDAPIPSPAALAPKEEEMKEIIINEETKEEEKKIEEYTTEAIQSLIKLTETLHVTIPSSIPEAALPKLLPLTKTTEVTNVSAEKNEEEEEEVAEDTFDPDECKYNLENPFHSSILSARYLTNTTPAPSIEKLETHFDATKETDIKRVLEVSLQLPEDMEQDFFLPGDAIGLVIDNQYTNEFKDLMDIFKKMNIDIEKEGAIKLKSESKSKKTSVKDVFLSLDITGMVKKRALIHLAQVAANATEAHYLRYLSSKLGNSLFDNYVTQKHKTIVDILQDFPSCKPSPQLLYDILSPIAARYYSVASSPYESGNSLRIAFSVVDYVIDNKRKHGLATNYLERVSLPLLNNEKVTASIAIFPKSSTSNDTPFRLPSKIKEPLILIGPGTGVAPFLGFVSHLRESKAKCDVHLFFGCRYSKHDYLYQTELKKYQEDGIITKLYTAFSRDDPKNKKYVQTLLKENLEEMIDLIQKKEAYIYICGDGAMAKDVQKVLAKEVLNDDTSVEQLKENKKLLIDVWSL